MDFTPDEDHAALRAAVAEVAAGFGPDYYTRKAEAREGTDELWAALGKHGYLGVNIGEEYGGGGAGLAELAVVCEGTAAAGCPLLLMLVSCGISAEVIAAYGTAEQRQRWLPRLASGDGQDRLRDHRTGRWLQHPPARHHRRPGRRRLPAARPEVLHLRRRPGGRHPRRRPDRHRRGDRPGGAVAVRRRHRDARADRDAAAGLGHAPGTPVHPVPRRRAGERRPPYRQRGGRLPAGLPRAQPGADHRRRALRRHRPVRAGQGGRATPPSGPSGRRQSAPTRASRTSSRRPRSRWSPPR